MKYVKRLTTKTAGYDGDQLEQIAVDAGSSEVPVMRVFGRIVDLESAKSELGPYTKFKGEFEGVNLKSGERSRSYVLILPSVAEIALQTILASARVKDSKASCQFGIDLCVKYNKPRNDKGVKYMYGVTVLGDTPMEDALTVIGKQFGALPLLTDKTEKVSRRK